MAVLLRLEHRRFRVPQEAAGFITVLGEEADPDGSRHVELRAAGAERDGEGIQDSLRSGFGSCHGRFHVVALAFEVREQHQERVARTPGHQIRLARRFAEPGGDDVQNLVARQTPERVVHQPEVVDVDADDGDRGFMMPRADDRKLQKLLEHRPAREACELVVIGQEGNLLVTPFHVGDVDHDAEREGRGASFVADHPRLIVDPGETAVLPVDPVVERERLACFVVALVLGGRASTILRVDDPEPEIAVAQPFVWRVAEEILDLGAHVEGRGRIVQRIDVRDRRDMFDDRTVPISHDRLGRDLPLALHVVRDRAGHHTQQLDLARGPHPSATAVVRAQEPPPSIDEEDRDRHDRRGPLGRQHPSLGLRELCDRAGHHVAIPQLLDPSGEIG
jgi:hypothetical protein